MAVTINTYFSERIIEGSRPSVPSVPSSEVPPVVNPPGYPSGHSPVTLASPSNGLTLVGQELGLGLASSGVTGALSGTKFDEFDAKIGGSGTVNRLAKFTAIGTVGNSILIDDANGVYNTGKGNSTIFGFRAGLNDDGTNNANTFVGYNAGLNNTTGSFNSFFGFGAGSNNTTGTSNSFLGYNAGLNNTTGASNLFFGLFAGLNNTTGASNLFFGVSAGRFLSSGANLTVANNSVFLGFDTRANADSETNQIVIGYQAIGGGSNTVVIGNSSIVSNRLFGTLRVGTINNLGTSATVVLTKSATGVISERTVGEMLGDIGGISGSGVSGQVSYWNGAKSQEGSPSFLWNNSIKRLTIIGSNSGVQNPLYVDALGGDATRVYINHPTNSGFGLYLGSSLKWSFATYRSTFDFTIFNDNRSRIAIFIHQPTNNTVFCDLPTASLPIDSGYRVDIIGKLRSQGDFTLSESANIVLGTTTGTKIGTANTQKLAFWNSTPIVQPLETALANTPNTGDANTDALITALKNIILNTGLGRSA